MSELQELKAALQSAEADNATLRQRVTELATKIRAASKDIKIDERKPNAD